MRWFPKVFAGLLFLFLLACNQGIAPLEQEESLSQFSFPVSVEGGNPIGAWIPQPVNSVEFRILNPEVIQQFVDTLYIKPTFVGRFLFNADSSFVLQALLIVKVTPVINGIKLNISPFADTLLAQGKFSMPEPEVLILPYETHTFPLDTLGFTAKGDSLTLVTLPHVFPYPGFSEAEYFMVLHMIRQGGTPFPAVSGWPSAVFPKGVWNHVWSQSP